jgi:CheY-like chemotaxis protein
MVTDQVGNNITAIDNAIAAFSELRIALVACAAMDDVLAKSLRHAQVSFAQVDANLVSPGDPELDRYHALILHVGDFADEPDWFRPRHLRINSRPLLLAADPAVIFSRASLRDHADDIIFAPFLPIELTFRLSRLVSGTREGRHSVPPSAKPCVVVADDDPDMVAFLKCVLQRFDVEAHFANDGLTALSAARRLLPDLLLLDIELPIMNGIEVLSCLRDDPGTCSLATLLLTSSADSLHVKKGVDLGAVDYILKPCGYFDLIRKLKPFLAESKPCATIAASETAW